MNSQQTKRSLLGLLISLLIHGSILGALFWNWHTPHEAASNAPGEISTTISMEMIQGMRVEEPAPEPEPEPQQAEPEPEKQEVVADPEQVFPALLVERDAGPDAGMYEEIAAVHITDRQRAQEGKMGRRHLVNQRLRECPAFLSVGIRRGRQPVGHQRLQAAELPPLREHVGIDEKLQQTGLVIAEQADHAPVSPPLIEHRDHIARIRSAIDVVAEEHLDRPRRPELADIGIDAGADLAQQIGVPVDVADGVEIGRASCRERV